MPEITAAESVRVKLREFEHRLVPAINAAKALGQVKTDAEALLMKIQKIVSDAEEALDGSRTIGLQLQGFATEWESLKHETCEAERRLEQRYKSALLSQEQVFKQYELKARESADLAESAKSGALDASQRLEGLIGTMRSELTGEVNQGLVKAQKTIDSEVQRLELSIKNGVDANKQLIDAEIASIKEHLENRLSAQQQRLDQQVADFLNRQNALVQNLTQQIDSFNRVSAVQAADIASIKGQQAELNSCMDTDRRTIEGALANLNGRVTELKIVDDDLQSRVRRQEETIRPIIGMVKKNSEELDETIMKLAQLPIVGSRFK